MIINYSCGDQVFQVFMPDHAKAHTWRNGVPPSDAITVHPRMFSLMRGVIVEGSVLIKISPFYYIKNGEFQVVGETTLNTTPYLATQANKVRLAVVGFNLDTEAMEVYTGEEVVFSALTPPPLPIGLPSNYFPSFLVRLRYNTTELFETDITDARFALQESGGGSTDIAAEIHAAASKTTPVDADELALVDSAASFILKKLTWSNLKATLLTWLGTLLDATKVSKLWNDPDGDLVAIFADELGRLFTYDDLSIGNALELGAGGALVNEFSTDGTFTANSTQKVPVEQATKTYVDSKLGNNIFINGGFDVWQRTTNDTTASTTRKYIADRWHVITGAGTLANVQRSTTVRTGALSKYSCEMVGAASVAAVEIGQRIESALTARYKQTVAFSCYIYNSSGAAFTPKLLAITPSAVDDWTTNSTINGGGLGESLQSCADGAWTKVTWSADISGYSNINNGFGITIQIPSGSLVAGDTVRFAEMNLTPGSSFTPFATSDLRAEFPRCIPYYTKTFDYATVPGTGTTIGSTAFQTRTAIAASTAGALFAPGTKFLSRMRKIPTVTIYAETSGTANAVRNISVAADRGGATASGVSESGFRAISIDNTSATVISLDQVIGFQYVADAEL